MSETFNQETFSPGKFGLLLLSEELPRCWVIQ